MATAGDMGENVKCPICLERYVDPRKLPVCSHTFCKTCIISYVSKLDEDTELSENGFPCPFCRTLNPAPKSREVMSTEWVDSLNTIEDFAVENDNGFNEQGKNECDSCKVFGISTKATKVCTGCCQLFCVPCSVGRHSGKFYENHKVNDFDASKAKLIEDLRKLSDYSCCKEHPGSNLNFYCEDDNVACCSTCAIVYHRQCDKVVEINESHTEQETKTEMENMKISIDKITTFATKFLEIKKAAFTNIKQQIENIRDSLQDVRKKINQTLDILEETVNEKTKAVLKKQAINDEEESSAIKKQLSDLKNYSALVETAIECDSTSHFHRIYQNVKEKIRVLEIGILDICEVSTNTRDDPK